MIQVVKRVFNILSILRESGPLPLRELAERSGLQKTTCHNILKTLNEMDVTSSTPAGVYQTGPKLRYLASLPLGDNALKKIASIHVEQLAKQTGETVILVVLRDNLVKVISKAEGEQDVVVRADSHTNGPVYKWATGRVLLAYSKEKIVEDTVKTLGLPSREQWPEAAGSRERLKKELEKIRTLDALVRFPTGDDIMTIACPVRDTDDRVVAALGELVPGYRAGENVNKRIQMLKRTGEKIHKSLAELNTF